MIIEKNNLLEVYKLIELNLCYCGIFILDRKVQV